MSSRLDTLVGVDKVLAALDLSFSSMLLPLGVWSRQCTKRVCTEPSETGEPAVSRPARKQKMTDYVKGDDKAVVDDEKWV